MLALGLMADQPSSVRPDSIDAFVEIRSKSRADSDMMYPSSPIRSGSSRRVPSVRAAMEETREALSKTQIQVLLV
jgi:hypothetical protein